MDFKNFIQFFKDENAYGIDFLQIEENKLLGRGIKTLKDHKLNSKVLCIPKKFLITIEAASCEKSFGPFLKSINTTLTDDNILSTYLLFLKSQNDDTFEKSYIKMLPPNYNTFYFFTDDERDIIAGSTLYKTSKLLKEQIKKDFEVLKNLFGNIIAFTFEDYEWALFTIWSRSMDFVIGDKKLRVLAPLADMFNHSSEIAQCHMYELSTGNVIIYAGKDYVKNEQVFINYGKLSNTHLLLYYGFVIDDNEFNSYVLHVDTETTAPHFDLKKSLFKKYNLNVISRFTICYQNLIPSELLLYLRIQQATYEELKDCKDFNIMLSKKNELMILNYLLLSLESILLEFRYSIVELSSMESRNENINKAVTVSIEEQNLLNLAIKKLSELIDSYTEQL